MKGTPICPEIVATVVVDRLQRELRVELKDAEGIITRLAERCESCFQHNKKFKKMLLGRNGLNWTYSFMQHWLSALLCKEQPKVFKLISEDYMVGRTNNARKG